MQWLSPLFGSTWAYKVGLLPRTYGLIPCNTRTDVRYMEVWQTYAAVTMKVRDDIVKLPVQFAKQRWHLHATLSLWLPCASLQEECNHFRGAWIIEFVKLPKKIRQVETVQKDQRTKKGRKEFFFRPRYVTALINNYISFSYTRNCNFSSLRVTCALSSLSLYVT